MTRYVGLVIGFCFLAFTACGSDNPALDTSGEDINGLEDVVSEDTVTHDEGVEDTNRPEVPGEDTNVPPEDVPGEDTNVPPVDVPGEDTNVPPVDVPGEDTNVPPVDVPGEDTNVPPEDVPLVDVPVEDVPVEDTPVEDVPMADVDEETEMPWMCTSDDDCVDWFEEDDIAMCNRAACDTESGECVIIAQDDGTECSDGDFCTAPDSCVAGECIPGGGVTCDDGNACTYDECTAGACVNTPDTTVLTCGQGPCYREIPACADGIVNECIPGDPASETCDMIDNDCDGIVDNNIPEVGVACDSDLFGPCLAGTMACVDGALVCNPNVLPQAEKCDKLDNDCDGIIDNNPISSGNPCAVSGQLGACGVGETGCTNGLIVCVQTVFPTAEKCDGLDNDCDNNIDEDSPGAGVPCSTGLPGVCNEGVTSCATGTLACAQTGFPGVEICDGLDNDCDGIIDPPNTAGCTVYYKDSDADGYGSAETLCLCAPTAPYTTTANGDCCDSDSRAKPVGAAPYTSQNNCNSWDYNCDGTVSYQYNYGDGSCGGLVYCKADMVEGWKGAAPGCGQVGIYLENCTLEFIPPVCQETTKNLTQGCF